MTAVLVLGASTAQMGLLTAIGGGSALLFGLAAGVWADRLRRRPIMIAADLGRAALLASIPLAAAWGRLGMAQLFVVTALAGVLTVFFDVSYRSFLPAIVDREQLLDGNSKLALSFSVAEVSGPGITGVLVQLITAPIAILFDAISFLFSALTIWLIRKKEPAPIPQVHQGWLEEIAAGLKFMAGEPILRALAVRSATAFLFMGLIGPLYILYALRELGFGPAALGFAIAAGGLGNLIGAGLAPALVRRLGIGRMFVTGSVVYAVMLFLIPLAHRPLGFALTCILAQQLFGDAAFGVFEVGEISIRQTLAPDRVLGRVNAAMQLLTRGVWSLGAVFGGFLAAAIGIRPTLAVAASGVLLSSGWLVFSPARRLKEVPATPGAR